MAIDNIIIVGGGTAGWMAAAALSRLRAGSPVAITLVESEVIGTVGVGEATIPPFLDFNRLLEIDEREMLAAVQGSFKLGIQFVNWGKQGDSYIHPFGNYGYQMEGVSFHHVWHKYRQAGDNRPIQVFNMETMAAHFGRFARTEDYQREDLPPVNYAYHIDAGRYARFLRSYAEARGVVRKEGKVIDVALNGESGFVTSITLDDGTTIAGDLFIDCSGFRGLLIEQTLKTGYDEWTNFLPCDRAVALPCKREGGSGPLPYTRATAHSAGWQWQVPLQHRNGNGHVYCSSYISDDDARAAVVDQLESPPLSDARFLRFKTGKRRQQWSKNVVAIGLSAGFLEPLESTSIHLIQLAIGRLLDLFPDLNWDPTAETEYNRLMDLEYERVRDFLILHYHATERTDTPFWNYVRTMPIPDSLAHKMSTFRERGVVVNYRDGMFLDASWIAVYAGQRIVPQRPDPRSMVIGDAQLFMQLAQMKDDCAAAAATLPAQADFLRQIGANAH